MSWLAAILKRSGLRAEVERYRREREQQQTRTRSDARPIWSNVLHDLKLSPLYPVLVGLLALISAGTGLYPFGPVLIAFVVFSPERWRSVYLAACIGATTGSMILAHTAQLLGWHLMAEYFPGLEHSEKWMRAEKWVVAYGVWALAAIAAMPLPQLPPLLILALAKTPTSFIGLAIFSGKILKYGAYVLGIRLVLKAIHTGLHQAPKSD